MKLNQLLLVLLMSTLCISKMHSCSCIIVKEKLNRKVVRSLSTSDVVFIGTVIRETPIDTFDTKYSSKDPISFTFEVKELFKGKFDGREIQILTEMEGISCGHPFIVGDTYLVYAKISDHFKPFTGNNHDFITSLCNRNQEEQKIKSREINILRK